MPLARGRPNPIEKPAMVWSQAGYALWLFVVQREACGLNKIDHVIQVYRVPNEVVARMGPLTEPRIHPAKTLGLEARAPMF